MTREQFIATFRHEIDGWVLDAAMSGHRGSDLSMFLRMMRGKIETKLASMYDALIPPKPVPVNGEAKPKETRK